MKKKYIITEEQFKKLVEKKKTDKRVINQIVEDIKRAQSSLNESQMINEAVVDTIRTYFRKGLLTTAVIVSLLAGGAVTAQTLQQAGVPQEEIVQAQQGGDTMQDVQEKGGDDKMYNVKYADNSWSTRKDGHVMGEIKRIAKEYAQWKVKQPDPTRGNDIQISIIGVASADLSNPIMAKAATDSVYKQKGMSPQQVAMAANKTLAQLRANETMEWLVKGIVHEMRNNQGVKNFKMRSAQIGQTDQLAMGWKILGKGDKNQFTEIRVAYGDMAEQGNAKTHLKQRLGTRNAQTGEILDNSEIRHVIDDIYDIKNNIAYSITMTTLGGQNDNPKFALF